MAKKKLLNEATVRRFMGLAGMESNLVSNAITEMYSYNEEEEEEELDAEEPAMDDMGDTEAPEMELGQPEAPIEAPAAEEDSVVNLDQELVNDLMAAKETINAVAAALAGESAEPAMDDMEMAPEPAMDDMETAPEEEPMGDIADEEEVEDDMLEGINLGLSEDEVVQEVAKRVAKRILRAKKAKRELDEALGRKTRK